MANYLLSSQINDFKFKDMRYTIAIKNQPILAENNLFSTVFLVKITGS